MKRYLPATLLLISFALTTQAEAYVGPGAGLSLLGAFWALLVALGTAVAFIVAWPLRKALRRRRQAASATSRAESESEAGTGRTGSGAQHG